VEGSGWCAGIPALPSPILPGCLVFQSSRLLVCPSLFPALDQPTLFCNSGHFEATFQ